MWKNNGGFTLVELLAVMGVIAILTMMALVINISRDAAKGRDGQRQVHLGQIQSSLELYKYENGGYPTGSGNAATVLSSLVPTYMQAVPVDPSNASKAYYYRYAGTGTCGTTCSTYNLCALEELVGTSVGCGNCDDSPATACTYKVNNP